MLTTAKSPQVEAAVVMSPSLSPLVDNNSNNNDVSAVYDLIDRVLPVGGRHHFVLQLDGGDCIEQIDESRTTSNNNNKDDDDDDGDNKDRDDHRPCFSLQDINSTDTDMTTTTATMTTDDGRNNNKQQQLLLLVRGTTVSELSAGIGYYLRHYCNMTIGWPHGGGSNVFLPTEWPTIGDGGNGVVTIKRRRRTPYNYLMNVCTHSYSLVWYGWSEWEQFIDWMSLSGINLMLALTGQEEVQYKVFTQLGLSDHDVRSWFNGPAYLTWSRGQNEYGSDICGPLPRSWMKRQWWLQKYRILPRLRSLRIIGQLPAFQGNVPIQLKYLYKDSNITEAGATGWMDSLDPLFGTIADLWMETLIHDFGTDHWYQMDGYFDGSTAPWLRLLHEKKEEQRDIVPTEVTSTASTASVRRNDLAYRRGVAAYTGLNRTDPEAIWSFQGWAIVGWESSEQAAFLKGFVDSAPLGKMVIIDMSRNGEGQWKQWNNASFFGAPFVWTTLLNFGATDGMKGDMSKVNRIPFDGPSTAIGTGATPEGIDQNPAYFEFVFDQHFREAPVTDIHSHMVQRSHRRYGLADVNVKVSKAWSLLVDSAYAQDLSTQDATGIAHLHPRDGDAASLFELDRRTPRPVLCKVFRAWELLFEAAEDDPPFPGFKNEPFNYDLVNLGREVLAQISTPAVLNFSDATTRTRMDRNEVATTGSFYIDILNDTDRLVATDYAFLLGPWIQSARRLGKSKYDCPSKVLESSSCEKFYEWNARTQITTWNPATRKSQTVPGGPIDYAAKHWSGLIRDYYLPRATLLMKQALVDQSTGRALNETKVASLHAQLAYNWTTSFDRYPVDPIGDALSVSRQMLEKYKHWFSSCVPSDGIVEVVS